MWALWFLVVSVAAQAATEEAARKVLASRCWACHAQTAAAGLRLDSREAMLRGGQSGPAITPGRAADSRLYQAVSRDHPDVKPMPPGAGLSAVEVQTLKEWINEGAAWSGPGDHWSYRALRRIRPGEGIDTLIDDSLRARQLAANPPADKRTLIRRVYFDLIGLPPDEREFAAAFTDRRPDWYSRLVSDLLASRHFGEKWGRHWLDVARYGEDDFTGTAVVSYSNSWRYRDWVVSAINEDLPYDRFLMAQLAGDRLNDPKLLPATGLLGLGPWYYGISQPPQARADERHDRVDMVTRGMLGVTVACARCHDHKYDPFTASDYYALAGVFASTGYKEYPLVPKDEADAWAKDKAAVEAAEKALNKYLDEQSIALAEHYATQIAGYMIAASGGAKETGFDAKVLDRWQAYLSKPEENHPFLQTWFRDKNAANAQAFQALILQIEQEKKSVDAENARLLEAAKKAAPPVRRTIVLPGGYRSDEDFNPGADVPALSLPRDRFVAWNRIFGEASAPLKFDRELTTNLLPSEARAKYDELKAKLDNLKKALAPQYPYLHGAEDFSPIDLPLTIRGNPESHGAITPRRFPLVLSGGEIIPLNEGSGRLQLATTVAHHPLAARVAVNRVWMNLFSEGLVRTPSNLGSVGDRPVLPDLLEYLAARLVEKEYSMKALIREIVLSSAYQRSSERNLQNEKLDGENRYLWRQNRRRLQAEPLLDAMLAVSGELDRSIGGESKPLNGEFHRRAVYAKTSRFQQDETMSLFDLPSAVVTCEQRVVTNVPLQKLFFLNSDILAQRASGFGKLIEHELEDEGITKAYRTLFLRDASQQERRLGRGFLQTATGDRWKQYAWVLLSSNEFAYVD